MHMTSRFFIIVAFLGLAANARAQILNPGFELAGGTSASAANWTVTQAAGGPVYGVRTNSSPHTAPTFSKCAWLALAPGR